MTDLNKQLILDETFLASLAPIAKNLSHCVSRQVAAAAVKDGRILVTGINGTAPGTINCDQLFPHDGFDAIDHRIWSDENETHAEMNVINFAAKFGISINGATLYCTLQPCMQCSKNLPMAGIKRIVFSSFYDRVEDYEQQKIQLSRKGVEIFSIEEMRNLVKNATLHNS